MAIRQISVIGAGTMGRGIAYLSAAAGYDTVLFDLEESGLAAARVHIESTFARAVEKKKLSEEAVSAALARIQYIPDLESVARGANLIIEAVPENEEMKRTIFSEVDIFCAEDTIIASNTSSISISRLAGSVERREKFLGLHFFNPPHLMKLVEIVLGERTSESTVAAAQEVVQRMGKESIVVRDTPGFATSRLGVAIGLEAIRMLEEGVASAADIDRAMELGYNHPMGPLRLTDLVGLDVRLGIAEVLAASLGERFEPPVLLREMVAEGKLGKKTGRGFYEWSE